MLTNKEQKALERMEKQLAMPAGKFVLIYGVLGWGITTALLYTIVMSFIRGRTLTEVLEKDIWVNLLTFMLAGIFFGVIFRKLLPRYIRQLKEKENQP